MAGGGSVGSLKERRIIGDRYELEALVGRGAIGEVWRARHIALNSRVAVKFLQLHSSEHETKGAASKIRRFTAEARITAQLKTPHAVQVFDFGITDWGQPYLVMELLEGETLGRRLERVHRLGPHDTVNLLGQAARALHRAHQLGIVHRDFKPDNVVVCSDEEGRDYVKVLDFGIAKIVGALEGAAEGEESPDAPLAPSFTRTGSVLGTPLYMAPEQVRNAADVDSRADLWAFGVVAFECLTGRPPFRAATIEELFDRILSGAHASAHFLEESVPASFDAWFEVACAMNPAKRYMNASVAWKQLALALNVETQTSVGDLLSLTSGERPIAALTGKGVDAGSSLDDDTTLKRVIGRSTGSFTSMRRVPLRDEPPTAPAAPSSAHATSPMARSADDQPRRAGTASVWVAMVGALVLLAALALWRASGTAPVAPAASVHGGATPNEAPSTPVKMAVPTGAEVPEVLASVVTVDASAPKVSAPTASHARARPTPPAASHAALPAASSAASPLPVAVAPPAAPAPTPTQAPSSVVAPSAPRPDPLGERQ